MLTSLRPLTSLLIGTSVFTLQVAASGLVGFATLSEKVRSFAGQALATILDNPLAWSWLGIYAAIGILIHTIPFSLAFKFVADLTETAPPKIQQIASQKGTGLLVGFLLLGTMASWNIYLFPKTLSSPSESAAGPLGDLLVPACFSVASVLLVILWLTVAASKRARAFCALACCIPLGVSAIPMSAIPDRLDERPDIIILGVDSLRQDHLDLDRPPLAGTETLRGFISAAVNFESAYTPMGRTFVAYMSILSGQYPTSHGVRENLWPRDMIVREKLLPQLLQQAGYTTIYGMDEVRFANVSTDFGFDLVVTPPPGAVELMAGTLVNTIGTNLLQLVPGSDRIAPHIAGNRALVESYLPQTQVKKLDRAIMDSRADRPLFLVAHFCIAHSPFATGRFSEETLPHELKDSPRQYRKAIQLADDQIDSVLDSLRKAGRLRNAIVVLLSDHGEGLGMAKDKLAAIGDKFLLPSEFGHGTFALSPAQSNVVLAMQRFRDDKPVWHPRRVRELVSLVDVAPTLLALSGMHEGLLETDGVAILDSEGRPAAPRERPLFIESGMSGQSLAAKTVDPNEVADEFSHLYRVVEDLRFELLPSELDEIIQRKQRGVIMGKYGVSSLPGPQQCWLLVDFETKTRSCYAAAEANATVKRYAQLVCEHFRGDKSFQTEWCNEQNRTLQ